MTDPGSDALLEREGELAVIDRFVASDTVRSGGLLLIRGPAGIGKTRLLDAVAGRAETQGFAVHAARAGELEGDLAWGVVRQLFAPVLARSHTGGPGPALSGAAQLARPALGLGSEAVVGADALSAALHGLYWLAADLTERAPLLLAVDDVQWADPASARYLQYLAKRLADLPVRLAVTVRPGDARAAARADALGDGLDPVVLEPRPLTLRASARLMASALGREPDAEFLEACRAATGGNPFLLTELALQLASDGVAPVAAEAGRVAEMTPDAVARSVLRRLSALAPDAVAVARTIAVLGGAAELAVVAALTGLDEAGTVDAADALVAAELLRGEAPLHFVHPLVGAAVHNAIPPLARRAAHAAAARALAERGADDEAIAAQLTQSGVIGAGWAVERLRAAAVSARGRGAPEEASAYLARALREAPQGDRRAAVLLELGSVEAELRGPQALDHLRDACDVAVDPTIRAAATLALAGALVLGVGNLEAIDRLRATLAATAGTAREIDLQLHAALISASWYLESPDDDAKTLPVTADELAGATPGERIMLSALAADSLFGAAEPAHVAVGLLERALDSGGFVQDLGPEFISFWQSMYLLHAADALDTAERYEAAAFEVARSHGAATALSMAATYAADALLRRGLLREAEAEIDQALALNAPWPFFPMIAAHIAIETLIERGRLADAIAVADRLDDYRDGPLWLNELFPLCSRGRLRLAQRRPEDALADFRRVGREAATRNPAVHPWRSGAATALAALGRPEEARELVAEELALARVFGVARPLGIALRGMGTIAGPRRGLDALRESVEVLEASHAPLERAHSQLELGSALRRSGKRAEAVPLLREALDTAERCAAEPLAERARRELVDAGSRPHRPARLGRDVLTPSELTVARLAATGHANKDIAQTLFVSLRTVETHLTHAYAKLGITARQQLADALATTVKSSA